MEQNKRILLITNNFPPEIGSAAQLFWDLARGLSSRDYEVNVLTTFPRDYNMECPEYSPAHSSWRFLVRGSSDGFKTVRTRIPRIPKGDVWFRGLEMFIVSAMLFPFIILEVRKFKPNLIVVYSPPLPLAFASILAARLNEIPIITNIQDIYPKTVIDVGLMKNGILIDIFERLEKYVYNNSDAITVHSEGNERHVVSMARKDAFVEVIHNCFRMPAATTSSPSELPFEEKLRNRHIVTYAGVIAFHQGLDVIIEAANLLTKDEKVLFLIVGDGLEKDRLVDKAMRLGLHNVIFEGFQSQIKYQRLLELSDIMLVTLRKDINPEVVPGKIQSIMIAGKPLIACIPLQGDAASIIDKAQCGICCEPGGAQSLAEAIVNLCSQPELRKKYGENGKCYAEVHFSPESYIAAYENLFRKIEGP